MASIIIASTPVHGHVTPLLAVAEALVAAGDRVRFLTGARYEAAVRSTGAEYLPLPPEADYDDRDIDAAFPGRRGLTGPKGIRYDMIEIFLRPVPTQLRALDAALAAEPADAVLAESMFAAAAVLTALPRHERPLIVNLGITPLAYSHPDVAPFGLGIQPRPGAIGRLRNMALKTMTEKIIFAPVQRFADELSRAAVGRPLPQFFLNWLAGADHIVHFSVPEFEYERRGLPESVHFVGPVSRARSSDAPLPDWWDDLHSGRPVVHVTQGTVANSEWNLIEPTIRALAGDDVTVVVSTGGRPVTELPEDLPQNVRVASFLPYDKLLPITDVLITNGGYGGVHYAFEHGVPVIAAGRTEDKAEVAARVAWSGAGIDLRTEKPTPDAISHAVRQVLTDRRFTERARLLGAAIRRSAGPAAVHQIVAEALGAPAVR